MSKKDDLKDLGFADSKTLTEEQREELFEKLVEASEIIGWSVVILAPNAISNGMLGRQKYNLNAMSHDTAIGLIQSALDRGANVQEVYVDTVGPPDKYQAKLKSIFPQLKIVVEKKADATYSIVSAASICAKVARDRAVKNWKFMEGGDYAEMEYGSGYPSDPHTKTFMENVDPVFGFPQFVRFSWSTASTVLGKKAVPVHWEDDDDEEEYDTAGSAQILSYFTVKQNTKKPHLFFKERCLKPAAAL